MEARSEHSIKLLDDEDRLVVSAALDGGAELLVTGDRHLLRSVVEGLQIVTSRKFLEILEPANRN